MDPTTLVTFLFRAPAEARTVELLGSWDRFSQPYRMHNDRRRGIWSGIFKFENISFDGDDLRWTKPRTGGLRQGSTYWYYYRINSFDDAFDERQPSTLSCPLIPGQMVNIIDVPMELIELPSRCCSSSNIEGSLQNWQQLQTLDPATKYVMLEPPPISKIHARSLSDGTLHGRLENQPLIIVEEPLSRPSTPDFECPGSIPADRADSSNGVSRDCSVYSRDTSCSDTLTHNPLGESAPEPTVFPTSKILDAAASTTEDPQDRSAAHDLANTPATDLWLPETQPAPFASKAFSAMRKMSALSIGPVSIQNVQFYNESRPGTMLNDDLEQHRPRVYSLPNSEIRGSEDESWQVSPMSTALQRPVTSQPREDSPTPDSDVAEFDLGSPSFSVATASSDGEASPLHLSPQNSIKENTRPASRSGGGALSGLANRFRSIRARQRSLVSRRETDQPSTRLKPPSFVNYALPAHAESDHSLAKTKSNPSAHARSAHEHMPMPTVFNNEPPLPSRYPDEVETSLVDDIFSELGYLGASIG